MKESLSQQLSTRVEHLVWTETILLAVINVAAFFGNLSVCLRCVQKPEASHACQYVCSSIGNERYFIIRQQYALFSCNIGSSASWIFRYKFLPISGFGDVYVKQWYLFIQWESSQSADISAW